MSDHSTTSQPAPAGPPTEHAKTPAAAEDRPIPITPAEQAKPEKPLPCTACGYDLRGLTTTSCEPEAAGRMRSLGGLGKGARGGLRGRCPECGTAIADSLGGRSILLSSPGFIRSVAAGAKLTALSVALYPAAVVAVAFPALVGLIGGERLIDVLWWRWPWLVGAALACELALGWGVLTTPERLADGSRSRGRHVLIARGARAAAVGGMVLTVGAAGLVLGSREAVADLVDRVFGLPWWVGDVLLIGCALGALACLLGAHMLGMLAASRLAGRARDWALQERLARLARAPVKIAMYYGLALVCLPVVMLMDLILGIVPLIYLVAVHLAVPVAVTAVVVGSARGLWRLGGVLGGTLGYHPAVRTGRVGGGGGGVSPGGVS